MALDWVPDAVGEPEPLGIVDVSVGSGASEKTVVCLVTVTTDELGIVCVMPESVVGAGLAISAEGDSSTPTGGTSWGQLSRAHGSTLQHPLNAFLVHV